jgi:putative ABC transport system substrate-binding protein
MLEDSTMRLSVIGLLVTFALGLFWTPLVATAQQPVKLIGVLGLGFAPSEAQRQASPFRQKLRELGWIEGQNITFEGRFAAGKLDRLTDLAADLVRRRPDIIVTVGTQGVRAAQQATEIAGYVANFA